MAGTKTKFNKFEQHMALCRAARENFWIYCQLLSGDFYKPNRKHLKHLALKLQHFVMDDKKNKVMIISMPPRHGKSRTTSLFVSWMIGNHPDKKVITASYNKTLSRQLSRNARDIILQDGAKDANSATFSEVFPDVHVQKGQLQADQWSITGGQPSYLATSPSSTTTGFGGDLILIDDIVASAETAHNKIALDNIWDWYTNTLASRREHGGKIIVIMTRWSKDDLAGRIERFDEEHNHQLGVVTLKLKAYNEKTGEMLCPSILSKRDYELQKQTAQSDIFMANYQQEPIDIKGRLYGDFQTYDSEVINTFDKVWAYVDPADKGEDYLAGFVWGERRNDNHAYIIDTMFTQDPMSKTERELPRFLNRNNVNEIKIEANNGGEGFARRVKERVQHGVVKTFSQTAHKDSRIYSNSAAVMERVLFPKGWSARWPDLFADLYQYQAQGKNRHDDAEDALTGVIETMDKNNHASAAFTARVFELLK